MLNAFIYSVNTKLTFPLGFKSVSILIINIFSISPSPNDDLLLLAGLSSMQWLKLQCVTLC